MNNSFYFKHSNNARNNSKTTKLRMKLGWEGYGLFWGMVEQAYENNGYLSDSVEEIAFCLNTSQATLEATLELGLEVGLFQRTKKGITNNEILDQLEARSKIVEGGRKGGKANKYNTSSSPPSSPPSSLPKATPQAGEERKGEERKEKEKRDKIQDGDFSTEQVKHKIELERWFEGFDEFRDNARIMAYNVIRKYPIEQIKKARNVVDTNLSPSVGLFYRVLKGEEETMKVEKQHSQIMENEMTDEQYEKAREKAEEVKNSIKSKWSVL